jgi:hypothetical protein
MRRYQSLKGGNMNKRIASKIKDCLRRGKTVKIFALKPELKLKYKGMRIDMVKGLKSPLIFRLRNGIYKNEV